jgi:transmembrane sensor
MGASFSSIGPRRQIVTEACGWFIEFRTGEVTAETRDRFDEWLRHSPEHIQAYLEVAAAWAELPTSDSQNRIDLSRLLARAQASRDEDVLVSFAVTAGRRGQLSDSAVKNAAGSRALSVRQAVAAGIAIFMLIAGLAGWLTLRRGETYTTDIGEQRTIRLPDDSVIDLNARSSIRVRYSKAARLIDLVQGQALFHVAKDPKRPFIVRSDATAVRAVGTEFDVYRKGSGLVVTVVEGRVAVVSRVATPDITSDMTNATPLSAGEQLTVAPRVAPKPHHADVSVATAWVQRHLIFEETPLSEVAEEFNRYSVRRLIIDDPDLARQPLSGVYSSTDPTSLIGFLRTQPGIQVIESEREIRVVRNSAGAASDRE